ncbi:MAG: hypothetical protein WC693_01665 [Patescibacteria group bacterium]|jgi:type II secretory pathway pseudopilin PulG
MLFRRITKNNIGQSLIELVVAVSIILIGVVSTLVLTVTTIRGGKASKMQAVAGNLAREGIEVVKQQRYNNWLKIESNNLSFVDWDQGLYNDLYENVLTVEFNSSTPAWNLNFNIQATTTQECIDDPNSKCLLYLKNGIYSHDSTGIATPFYRVVTINSICKKASDGIEEFRTYWDCGTDEKVGVQVISNVFWKEKGSWNSVMLEDHLYNWK